MTEKYTVQDLSAFRGSKAKVGVGYKFRAFDDGDLSIEPGDVAAFKDPDAGQHVGACELIHDREIVAFVDCVYAVDYSWTDDDTHAVEVGTTGPLGRLSPSDRYVGIVAEDGTYGGMDESQARTLAGRLVDHSEYDRYYESEWHLGEDGVPEGLWAEYDESDRSGPGCDVCMGSGHKTTGE